MRRTSPLYEEAIATARRGWQLGIPAAAYWLAARRSLNRRRLLVSEGITFIGSTYADVRHGVVLLDPQDERIEPDLIISPSENGELLLDWRATNGAVAA